MASLSRADVESDIAAYATSFSLQDVPEPVKAKARLVLLDTVGVCIRGSTAEYVRESVETYTEFAGGGGDSTVFATRDTGSPMIAAEANATGGTTLELDEGNQRSAHMGIHTVPSALAVAEAVDASGTELLEAVVLAYEVSARLGDIVRPMSDGLHPHGAWAPVAGAVATAHLLNFDEDEHREALRMAVNPFVVGHWAACTEGATVRNFYSGTASVHGMKAALRASSGVTGVHDASHRCLLPYVTERDVARETLVAGYDTLGEEFYLEDSYFKMHAACRYTHAPVEGLEQLLSDNDLAPGDVERITVKTYEAGTRLSDSNPTNVLSAKFSTPYVLAARLLYGGSGVDAFSEELIGRDDVRALANRVDVVFDGRYDELAEEGQWGAQVEIETTGGEILSESVENARGGGDNPFTQDEVLQKFDDLVVDVTSPQTTTRLRESLLNIEEVSDVSGLFAPLR